MQKITPIILAGGSGTRLWPLSRRYYPKQFMKLRELGGHSLFQQTIERARHIADDEAIRIVTNSDYMFHCLTQADEIGLTLREDQLIIEPMARGTLAAITLAMRELSDADIGLVTPSDNIIGDTDSYLTTIQNSLERASESLVTFGVVPNSPNTGYGYISCARTDTLPWRVQAFHEKPDRTAAERYIRDGYLWNSGSFLFSKRAFFSELKKWNGEYAQKFETSASISEIFEVLPDLSIDYGLLEHSDNIFVSPITCYWDDLGSWDAIGDYLDSQDIRNPSAIEVESKDNLILSETSDKTIALVGVDNLLVIDTPDALLISKKGESQKIKEVVAELKKQGSSKTDYGTTVYRPWGSYTIIDEGEGFKSKRLTVLPGKKLSLQMHHHRSEHWVVVSGTAQVTVGDQIILLKKGESTFIPIGTKHRLENPGKTDLHLIESQIGDYLEEDDIVRFDDEFGRA